MSLDEMGVKLIGMRSRERAVGGALGSSALTVSGPYVRGNRGRDELR